MSCAVNLDDADIIEVSISPNPASSLVSIEGLEVSDKVRLYDLNGNLIIDNLSNSFDISTLNTGVYIITIVRDTSCNRHKLVKTL